MIELKQLELAKMLADFSFGLETDPSNMKDLEVKHEHVLFFSLPLYFPAMIVILRTKTRNARNSLLKTN